MRSQSQHIDIIGYKTFVNSIYIDIPEINIRFNIMHYIIFKIDYEFMTVIKRFADSKKTYINLNIYNYRQMSYLHFTA